MHTNAGVVNFSRDLYSFKYRPRPSGVVDFSLFFFFKLEFLHFFQKDLGGIVKSFS